MDAHFNAFSGAMELNCERMSATPLVSSPVNCRSLTATPMGKSCLKASLSVVGGFAFSVAQPVNRTVMMARKTKFTNMDWVFIRLSCDRIFRCEFPPAFGQFIGHLYGHPFVKGINEQQNCADGEHEADDDADTNAVAVNDIRRRGELCV